MYLERDSKTRGRGHGSRLGRGHDGHDAGAVCRNEREAAGPSRRHAVEEYHAQGEYRHDENHNGLYRCLNVKNW